ncbi:MAG: hypothetical protein WCA14_16330 [Steroidobacteraceae bacterium]
MLICAAGDIHGAMDRLYHDVLAFEAALGMRFDYMLHVGDFGIWPNPNRIDKATRHHDGVGDFPVWLGENREAPRSTLFIKGNHEDFVWLDAHEDREVLPGLTYLRNGCTVDIQDRGVGAIRVGASAVATDRLITDDAPTGFKAPPSDTTLQTRSNSLRGLRAWTSCSRMTRRPACASSGIVAALVTSAKRLAWIRYLHGSGRASVSLAIITPESTQKFPVFAVLGSTKLRCPEIW